MARTVQQIQDSLRSSITSVDNRLDLKVGPLWDYLISPIPPELATIENRIDTVKIYYSPNFSTVATSAEARNFAVNFGTGPFIGTFAQSTVVFYRNSAPSAGLVYQVPIGSLVQTVDGTLVYSTSVAAVMSGDFAATYYNPARQRYELSVAVRAVAPGIKYNIPANHITKMMPTIYGFDGIVQTTDAVGGTEPEDSYDVATRVQKMFKGLERNSLSGIATIINQAEPTYVTSVTVIKPTDRVEFRRLTNGPSLDVCILGQNILPFNEDYLASGGEVVVPITVNKTATSVTSVAVNGNILDYATWTFVPDTSLEYQLSTRANPYIQLATALSTNDLVEIIGTRNDLLDEMQALFTGDNSIFYTDVLLRSYISLPIKVSLDIRITSGDPDSIAAQVTSLLTAFIQPFTGVPTTLIPDQIPGILTSNIAEIDIVNVLEFRRELGSISMVETVAPHKNQVPIFDTNAASITVRL